MKTKKKNQGNRVDKIMVCEYHESHTKSGCRVYRPPVGVTPYKKRKPHPVKYCQICGMIKDDARWLDAEITWKEKKAWGYYEGEAFKLEDEQSRTQLYFVKFV